MTIIPKDTRTLGEKLAEHYPCNNNMPGEVERIAAEAIRSAFFTSVSGEKPHRYHLSLAYPTMEAMHQAEDAIKAWSKAVLGAGEQP